MSSKLIHFPVLPTPARSPLFRNTSDTVPPTDELEALQAELKLLRHKSLERAKKAGEDLKTIEESWRRIKEREKGKAKAVEKVKRERALTPVLDADDRDFSPSINGSVKVRGLSLSVASLPPSSRASLDPRRPIPDEIKKKKKKRKRDEDSDLEHGNLQRPSTETVIQILRADSVRAVKTLPGPSLSVPLKPSKSLGFVANHVKSSFAPDFTLPPPTVLLPTRPPIPPPPVPGPSNATDVTEDFSKLKPPAQTPVNTFYSSIEPWIRGIKEEDVGFLEFTADEVEPYVIPKLGRHYLEVWEEADMAMYGGPLPGFSSGRLGESSTSVPKWDPSTLMEADLLTEERSHGPLTERLMSALLSMPDSTVWKGVKAAEDAMEGRPGGTGAAAAKREKVNVVDLEERVQDTMRFHGLLHEPPDYSTKVDDPIATALRHAQRRLRTVVAMNKARKERLAAITRDRLGYQEYLDLRSALDKSITSAYSKIQKKDEPKLNKKKKKITEANGSANGNTSGASAPKPSPAALGLGPDEDLHLMVPDHLQQLVETRRQWVASVGGVFDEKERECPGRIWGLPDEAFMKGLRRLQRTTQGNGDEMDVG
ncbi:histone acetyltransferases subunit 3-domain-containing protein [Suillus ampliporus]|nr:histone acetyltransferases subunit 3-domain-containing protein [Suillus ampliporus]